MVATLNLTVIIPIYNEALNISSLYNRLKPIMDKITPSYELLFVNDGSKDNSLELIKALALQDKTIRYISFSRNFGHQIAVTAGLDHANGNAIAIIDADLQDPPELIEILYNKMKEGYEVVYAKRRTRKDKSIIKRSAYKIFYRILAKIAHIDIPLDTGDFRIMDRKVVDVLKKMPEQHKFLRGQIAWIGFRQIAVEYDRDVRQAGEPGYTYKKLFTLALDGITSFSNLPLRFATVAGLIVSSFAFILIIYALASYWFFKGETPRGWTSIMLSVLFVGGIQLLSIGIIGEYISRLGTDIRSRPLYIVDENNI